MSALSWDSRAVRFAVYAAVAVCAAVPVFAYQRCTGSSGQAVVLRVDGQCGGMVRVAYETSRDLAVLDRHEVQASRLPWQSEELELANGIDLHLSADGVRCARLTCAVLVDGEVELRREAGAGTGAVRVDCNYTSRE